MVPLAGSWKGAHARALRHGVRAFDASLRAAAPAPAPLWTAYVEWLLELLCWPQLPPSLARTLRLRAARLCRAAHAARAASAEVYLRWATLHALSAAEQLGRLGPLEATVVELEPWQSTVAEAHTAARGRECAWPAPSLATALRVCAVGRRRHVDDAPLACLELQLLAAARGPAAAIDALEGASRKARRAAGAAWRLWFELAIQQHDASPDGPDATLLVRRFHVALLSSAGSGAALKVLLAEWLVRKCTLAQCRKLRAALLQAPPTPLPAYELLLAHELQHAPSQRGGPLAAHLRGLFEQCLGEHGRSAVGVWCRYASCHIARADFAAASALHRRALAALSERHHPAFTAAYSAEMHGASHPNDCEGD